MNLSTAIETMRYARELNSHYQISEALQQVIDSTGSLVSNPSDSNIQQSVRSALDNLANSMGNLNLELTEAEVVRLKELGAAKLFPENLYSGIVELFNANIATPAVSQENVQRIQNERNEILKGFKDVVNFAEARAWEADSAAEGGAEIGFMVPRAVFDNKLKGLSKELDWINRLLSSVTEASTGRHEDFQVSRLSTSDPTVFIVTSCAVALTFGRLVTWALATWKSVEEIRHLRAETAKLEAFTPEEVETIFGDKIKAQVNKKIKGQAEELTANVADVGRKNELQTGLTMLLEQFLQRVERGMTVEIKLIGQGEPEAEQDADEAGVRNDLETLAAGLAFPAASAVPVLKLTGGAEEDSRRSGRNAAPAKRAGPEEGKPKPTA